jgi:hypothetical protein
MRTNFKTLKNLTDLTVEYLKRYYQVKPWTTTERRFRQNET